MSIFIRLIILATCAYGGSFLAGSQFSDLAVDSYELPQR